MCQWGVKTGDAGSSTLHLLVAVRVDVGPYLLHSSRKGRQEEYIFKIKISETYATAGKTAVSSVFVGVEFHPIPCVQQNRTCRLSPGRDETETNEARSHLDLDPGTNAPVNSGRFFPAGVTKNLQPSAAPSNWNNSPLPRGFSTVGSMHLVHTHTGTTVLQRVSRQGLASGLAAPIIEAVREPADCWS